MKTLLKTFSIGLCFAIATAGFCAAAGEMKILNYGLYQVANESIATSTNSPTGQVRLNGTYKLLKQTDTIPAKLGSVFGFYFSIPEELRTKQIKLVYLFPEMKNPQSGKAFSRFEAVDPNPAHRSDSGVFYNLTDLWELVPGEWTFHVFIDDQKLVEKKFFVVKAD